MSKLEKEVEQLRYRVQELENLLAEKTPYRLFNLTEKEQRIVEVIASRISIHRDGLFIAVYGGINEPQLKIIEVYICKIRKKLPPDIEIKTIWGRGYTMPPESRERWKQYVNAAQDL